MLIFECFEVGWKGGQRLSDSETASATAATGHF